MRRKKMADGMSLLASILKNLSHPRENSMSQRLRVPWHTFNRDNLAFSTAWKNRARGRGARMHFELVKSRHARPTKMSARTEHCGLLRRSGRFFAPVHWNKLNEEVSNNVEMRSHSSALVLNRCSAKLWKLNFFFLLLSRLWRNLIIYFKI